MRTMMPVLRLITLVTLLAIAGIQARNFPDYAGDVQSSRKTVNEKTSFPYTSTDASNAANNDQITGFFSRIRQNLISNWFIAVRNCIPGLYSENYVRSAANLGRPPRPSPPPPRPPPGPHPVSYKELMPVSRRSPAQKSI